VVKWSFKEDVLMPTYEYRCRKCGHEFEDFKSMSAPPLTKCPKCKGKVDRLIGRGAGIIFKGSGFYETDYKRKNWKKDEAADKPASTVKSEGSTKSEGAVKKESSGTGESGSKSDGGVDKSAQNKKTEKKEKSSAKKND
jgi:putative FmdB family regulatory protein